MVKTVNSSSGDKDEQIRQTADVVAASRLQESTKKEPLVFDPFARLFVSSRGEEMLAIALKRWPFFSEYLMARAKFFDDHLKSFCERDHIEQVVALGVGNDMRALRLPFLKNRKVYEIDLPAQLENKTKILKKEGALPENVVYIGADIKQVNLADILAKNGFIPEEKSAFILEGLIYYLSPEAVDHLFLQITEILSAGSIILVDQISTDMIQKSSGSQKSPYPENPETYLTSRGFSIIESAFLGDLTKRYTGRTSKERWWAIACEK